MTGAGKRIIAILALALVTVLASPAQAAPPLALTADTERLDLAGHLDVLRDPSAKLTLQDILAAQASDGFKPAPGATNLGYDSAVIWLRGKARRTSGAPLDWLLEIDSAFLDQVTFYSEDGSGGFRESRTGDHLPFSSREVPFRTFVFKVHIDDDQPHPFYLRIRSSSPLSISGQVMSQDGFTRSAISRSLSGGFANGALIAVILFAIAQFAASRERLYLTFLAYSLPLEGSYLARSGLASQYLFPSTPLAADAMMGVCLCLAVGGGIVFAAKVLDFRQHYPRMDCLFMGIGRLSQLAAVTPLLGLYWLIAPGLLVLVLLAFPVTAYLAVRRILARDWLALWFLVAFMLQAMMNTLLIFRALGWGNVPPVTDLAAQLACVMQLILISYGLVRRNAHMEAHRRRTKQMQLESAHQIERALEERVAQRTMELAAANATLATEIAERRAAEERVVEREHQVRAILDAAPFPMMVAGFPEGTLMFLNQPASDLLNIPAAMAIGMRTTNLYVEPQDRDALLEKLHAKGAALGTELRIRRMPREQRWVLLSAVRFTYRGQDAALVCLNDISTRKQLEEMLRLANRRSEAALETERQAMREQRNFLAMVSHEFRVPLAIIEAASQLLCIYISSDDEAEDEVAKIRRAVRRMSDLIDICLADDRLDSKILSLRPDEVDLTRMLKDLCDDKRPFAGERELRLTVETPAVLVADATLLRIGLSNLIDNALKFSPPHSPVAIDVAMDDEAVVIKISDQGSGIVMAEQPHIFEKFYRSTKSDRVRGAGLGLYIVKRIVELHQGAISVDSDGCHGTTFAIWLPRQIDMQT